MIEYPAIGTRFGRLTVVGHGVKPSGVRCAVTRCDCGGGTETQIYDLWSGRAKSCGCVSREKIGKLSKTHGKSRQRVYENWCKMKGRCYNPDDASYKDYGGRGITISDEWRDSFERFYADMGDPPRGMSIDRVDNRKGYSRENCRWATNIEQQYNKTTNVMITYKGRTQPLGLWAKELGFKYHTLEGRIRNYHWPIERAMETPVRKGGPHV